jgi:hypothetical protein
MVNINKINTRVNTKCGHGGGGDYIYLLTKKKKHKQLVHHELNLSFAIGSNIKQKIPLFGSRTLY